MWLLSVSATSTTPPCNRYVVTGAGDPGANGVYTVVTGSVANISYELCSTAECSTPFQLYSMPAAPAAGTWRIKGRSGTIEYVALHQSKAVRGQYNVSQHTSRYKKRWAEGDKIVLLRISLKPSSYGKWMRRLQPLKKNKTS